MESIKNLLQFLNENWSVLIVILGLVVGIYEKIKAYLSLTNEEKINLAKVQIQTTMLKYITEAEIDYENWNKAGSVKRSQVISKIFADYPILSKITTQEEIISWIDEQINTSLKTLRQVIADNTTATE